MNGILRGPGERSLICYLRFGKSQRNVFTRCDVAEGTQGVIRRVEGQRRKD